MTVRPSPSDIFKSTSDLNKASVNFHKIDLETALTFAGIASHPTSDDTKRTRNQHNGFLFQSAHRRPQRGLGTLVGFQGEAGHRVGVSNPAAEADQIVILQLPQNSMTFRTYKY